MGIGYVNDSYSNGYGGWVTQNIFNKNNEMKDTKWCTYV